MAGTLVVIDPAGNSYHTQYTGSEPDLAQLQNAVGGYIEAVRCRLSGQERRAFVNEEGKLQQLPANPYATLMCAGFGYDLIVGNMAIVVPR